jgi:two-component system chemotaxis response regulator CheY
MAKKVLVVEDSAVMRSLVTSSLEELMDVETVEACNGLEAFKALPRDRFDLIVLDLNMPEINGWEVLRFVKQSELYKNIPVIIVSTDHGNANMEKGLSLGASFYFIKPVEMERLKETAWRCLN